MSNIFSVSGLTKQYKIMNNEVNVLKGIDLDIEEGKINFILGPSGAGKSTLLHIIGSLDRPTEGAVHFKDTDIFTLSDSKLSRWRNENIGFVFQFHYLLNDFSAYDNVMLPFIFSGGKLREGRQRTDELLEQLGMTHRKKHKPSELSGGEQQRIAVARAMINRPEVILADEPTGNLDSSNTQFIMDFFSKLNREQNTTFIIITHEQNLAPYAHRIIHLRDGMIAEE